METRVAINFEIAIIAMIALLFDATLASAFFSAPRPRLEEFFPRDGRRLQQ